MKDLKPRTAASNLVWIAISGIGVGWLVGLSVSPILGTVLTPIMAIAATGTAILSGIRTKDKDTPIIQDLRPIGILVLCISVGATIGMLARIQGGYWIMEQKVIAGNNINSTVGLFNSSGVNDICTTLMLNENPEVAIKLVESHSQLTDLDKVILTSVLKDDTIRQEALNKICDT